MGVEPENSRIGVSAAVVLGPVSPRAMPATCRVALVAALDWVRSGRGVPRWGLIQRAVRGTVDSPAELLIVRLDGHNFFLAGCLRIVSRGRPRALCVGLGLWCRLKGCKRARVCRAPAGKRALHVEPTRKNHRTISNPRGERLAFEAASRRSNHS